MRTLLREALELIEPLGLIWLSLLALTFVLWRKRLRALAAWPATLAVILYVFGSSDLPGALLRSLERPYAGFNPSAAPQVDAVVLLGGGLEPSKYEVGRLHLTRAGDRLIMALELMRLGKAPVLVCGGGAGELDEQPFSEADLLRDALLERGLPIPEIVSLGACRDTHDEAVRTRALAERRGWKRILLVSSANHLRRAVATFRTAGLDVVPAPANFLTSLSTTIPPLQFRAPSAGGFEKMSIWMHETIGWWEYRRRGWIQDEPATPNPAH